MPRAPGGCARATISISLRTSRPRWPRRAPRARSRCASTARGRHSGTPSPVKTDDPREHRMHAEWGVVTAAVAERINAARGRGGRIVAVGTTSLRLLESAAVETREVQEFSGETRLFILPGYRFRAINLLLT